MKRMSDLKAAISEQEHERDRLQSENGRIAGELQTLLIDNAWMWADLKSKLALLETLLKYENGRSLARRGVLLSDVLRLLN